MAGLGPMAGQNHHFGSYAPEKIPYAIDRYVKETGRLYAVLEQALAPTASSSSATTRSPTSRAIRGSSPSGSGRTSTSSRTSSAGRRRSRARPATQRAYAIAKTINVAAGDQRRGIAQDPVRAGPAHGSLNGAVPQRDVMRAAYCDARPSRSAEPSRRSGTPTPRRAARRPRSRLRRDTVRRRRAWNGLPWLTIARLAPGGHRRRQQRLQRRVALRIVGLRRAAAHARIGRRAAEHELGGFARAAERAREHRRRPGCCSRANRGADRARFGAARDR